MGVYERKNIWYIDYYANHRRIREKIGVSKKLAENTLKKREVEVAEGKHLDIKKESKATFDNLAKDFLKLHSKVNKKDLSYKRDLILIKNLAVEFSGRKLSEITSKMVEKFKERRIKEVSPATVNREVACLKCMFNKAIEWKEVSDNPVRKVKLLKENNQRVRYLEFEEIKALLDNCPEHFKPIVITALNTGMRKGEILGLKWEAIDIGRGLIYLTDTKNGERREVLINEELKKVLDKLKRHKKGPYVFPKKDGEPYKGVRKLFETALEKSGIINFKFHDLRHTFASHLVMMGVDMMTVKELMGHKSIKMTERYSHLSPAHKKSAIERLGTQMVTNWSQADKSQESES